MKRILTTGLFVLLAAAALNAADVADAAMQNDLAKVRALIAQKADVNEAQADGATALHWAVYRLNPELVAALLDAGANPSAKNREGATPMWLASVTSVPEILELLLHAGADANEKLPMGRTPLMVSARTGNVEAMKILLDAGADPNAAEEDRGTTPLMWAADQGHEEAIQLLIDNGADISAYSSPAQRGRGPALGKATDPRQQVERNAAAVAARLERERLEAEGVKVEVSETERRGNSLGGGFGRRGQQEPDGGGLTALVYATRANDLESVKALLDAGADINQVTRYGWSPLLVATQNRYYKLGEFLIEHGADVNLANKGGWTPLYLATDNRNIEGGDYPVRQPDMPHLDYIKMLLESGAEVDAKMVDSTQTRTVFTNQWLDEGGMTAFLRASQSGDLELMQLLLDYGANPKEMTDLKVTALQLVAGIGWVEGITFEWSREDSNRAVEWLLELGVDPNIQADTGRTALHGAGHKGMTEAVQMLVDAGADLSVRDFGNTDARGGAMAAHTWQAIDYADGLVRVGVQSAIAHPETAELIRKLMEERGLETPPAGRTLESICITEACG